MGVEFEGDHVAPPDRFRGGEDPGAVRQYHDWQRTGFRMVRNAQIASDRNPAGTVDFDLIASAAVLEAVGHAGFTPLHPERNLVEFGALLPPERFEIRRGWTVRNLFRRKEHADSPLEHLVPGVCRSGIRQRFAFRVAGGAEQCEPAGVGQALLYLKFLRGRNELFGDLLSVYKLFALEIFRLFRQRRERNGQLRRFTAAQNAGGRVAVGGDPGNRFRCKCCGENSHRQQSRKDETVFFHERKLLVLQRYDVETVQTGPLRVHVLFEVGPLS